MVGDKAGSCVVGNVEVEMIMALVFFGIVSGALAFASGMMAHSAAVEECPTEVAIFGVSGAGFVTATIVFAFLAGNIL